MLSMRRLLGIFRKINKLLAYEQALNKKAIHFERYGGWDRAIQGSCGVGGRADGWRGTGDRRGGNGLRVVFWHPGW